jgi:hypoxanthine-DNA glycosylase
MKTAFPPLADTQSNILILGTMPGERSLQLQQYYGNRQNQFWKLLFAIMQKPPSVNYSERIELLKEKHIALWDVLAQCEREGSLDSKIKNPVPNDFESFYSRYPNIKAVFFSSKNAEHLYSKLVGKKAGMKYYVLPSPSGANASQTFAQKLEHWSIIKDFVAQ